MSGFGPSRASGPSWRPQRLKADMAQASLGLLCSLLLLLLALLSSFAPRMTNWMSSGSTSTLDRNASAFSLTFLRYLRPVGWCIVCCANAHACDSLQGFLWGSVHLLKEEVERFQLEVQQDGASRDRRGSASRAEVLLGKALSKARSPLSVFFPRRRRGSGGPQRPSERSHHAPELQRPPSEAALPAGAARRAGGGGREGLRGRRRRCLVVTGSCPNAS